MGSAHISLQGQISRGPNAFEPSISSVSQHDTNPDPLLSCRVVSPPRLRLVLFLHPTSRPAPSHGGNGCAPPQHRRARDQALPPPPVSAAAEPAWLPRSRGFSLPAPAAACSLGRTREEGDRGQDGRGDHREVRPRVRPVENIQLQGARRRRRGEEVADRPGQGAPSQVRRRVPGHLHHALAHLLRPLLRPHQRRRRRAGPARQGRDRDGRDRREGGHIRTGLRRAQGRVADKVSADGGANAGGG